MTIQRKVDIALSTLFYSVVGLLMVNMLAAAYGCAAVKPACTVINLADMACQSVAVEFVDPATGKRTTATIHKSSLSGAVKAAASAEASK